MSTGNLIPQGIEQLAYLLHVCIWVVDILYDVSMYMCVVVLWLRHVSCNECTLLQ